MLLYEAPTGLAVFSFDGDCLNDPVESLEYFLRYDKVSTPIDLANEAIDDHLTKKLTRLCGSDKKLVVGNAGYKRMIQVKLGITCLYVDVPDWEVIKCSLENPRGPSLPQVKSETSKLLLREELITFLRQHDFDVKPEMVDKSVVEAAQRVHRIELRQKEHLKFLRILLKDFMVISGVDTTDWTLMLFATALKFICHPKASYQICWPKKIYSDDEYLKIKTNAPLYKRSFSKIGALALYEDVFSIRREMSVTLSRLDALDEIAKCLQEKAEVTRLCEDHFPGEPNRTDLPTTDSYHLEAPPNSVEPKQQVIPNQNCIAEGHHCLVPGQVQKKLTGSVEEIKKAGDSGVQSMDDDGKELTASTFPPALSRQAPEPTIAEGPCWACASHSSEHCHADMS
uniref:Uncharacterized protein n=1 Tax=Avena sativa TaxID=4498 RepID=A0ACD5TVN1_AVESA